MAKGLDAIEGSVVVGRELVPARAFAAYLAVLPGLRGGDGRRSFALRCWAVWVCGGRWAWFLVDDAVQGQPVRAQIGRNENATTEMKVFFSIYILYLYLYLL